MQLPKRFALAAKTLVYGNTKRWGMAPLLGTKLQPRQMFLKRVYFFLASLAHTGNQAVDLIRAQAPLERPHVIFPVAGAWPELLKRGLSI